MSKPYDIQNSDFLDRAMLLTNKLGRYNDLFQYSPAITFCLCVLHTPDLTSPRMTGYTLDCTTGALQHQAKFTLPGHIFTNLCPCYFECDMFSRFCYV